MPRSSGESSPTIRSTAVDAGGSFAGFAAPTSNTTYTPNQFFDVCLPHSSRGTARIVAYMLRKTLGWCNADGEPQEKRRAFTYGELEAAGIARGMIRSALDEAISGHFINCLRKPSSSQAGRSAVSGLYELCWDERPEYIKDPKRFAGFFAGEGNRTYIPNEYLDLVVPTEPLAVAKVVGSVVRFSIGFQNKWGHRRRNVALSYQHIQNYTRIKDRTTLSMALHRALRSNYIERVEKGYFDPNGGRLSKAGVYALRWLNQAPDEQTGTKTIPAKLEGENRYKNQTGTGTKTRPADRYENHTDIEIKQINKTLKQQDAAIELLKGEGFDGKSAAVIATHHSFEQIEQQIRWLSRRQVKSNRLGLLRAAIEGDWPAPNAKKLGRPNFSEERGLDFGDALENARRRFLGQ